VVLGLRALDLAASDYRVCVVGKDRSVVCWGDEDLVSSQPVKLR